MDERMNFNAAWRGYLSRLRVAGIVWAVTLGLLLFFTTWTHEWAGFAVGICAVALLLVTIFALGNLREAWGIMQARHRAKALPPDQQVCWTTGGSAGVIITTREITVFGPKIARVISLREPPVVAHHDAEGGRLVLSWQRTTGEKIGAGLGQVLAVAAVLDGPYSDVDLALDGGKAQEFSLTGPTELLAQGAELINVP